MTLSLLVSAFAPSSSSLIASPSIPSERTDEEPDQGLLHHFQQHNEQQPLFLNLRYYARHFIPIFCLVGIIGNCMALLLIRTNYWLRRLTSNVYLCTLSVCGCLFLATVLITWLDTSFGVPLYSDSEVGCKILTFMAHSCDFICVWMISWVSCDRAIVLFRPGIRRRICSKRFARNLVVGTVLFSSTLYGWCLVFAGLEATETDGSLYCGINPAVQGYDLKQLHIFFLMMDTILCTVIPSVLIMVFNSMSIYRYRQCMKVYSSGVLRVRFLRVPEQDEVKNTEETTTAKKQQFSSSTTQPTQTVVSTNTAGATRSANGGKLKSSDLTLSRSLLIVTSTFVLLNVPNYAFRLYEAVFDVQQTHLWQFAFFITYLLYYLHHAVLFYMYIFWSPQMKKQLMPTALKLLECYCFKTVPEFGHRQSQLSFQPAQHSKLVANRS
ncbi:hypothetical protein niasHT_023864 [Heterodera trifolii]|uniref:G-protein coupled receptors family 1 profile domain-containing protein n=1 Tax=Heterodera trifolii TaxID=157864 RepID=A0ABD2JCF4_9BILA